MQRMKNNQDISGERRGKSSLNIYKKTHPHLIGIQEN